MCKVVIIVSEKIVYKKYYVLNLILVYGDLFFMVGFNFVGFFQDIKKGNKCIVVLIDYLIKYVKVKVLVFKNVEEICEFIIEVVC